jgi:hypothetical protein
MPLVCITSGPGPTKRPITKKKKETSLFHSVQPASIISSTCQATADQPRICSGRVSHRLLTRLPIRQRVANRQALTAAPLGTLETKGSLLWPKDLAGNSQFQSCRTERAVEASRTQGNPPFSFQLRQFAPTRAKLLLRYDDG